MPITMMRGVLRGRKRDGLALIVGDDSVDGGRYRTSTVEAVRERLRELTRTETYTLVHFAFIVVF